MRRSEQQLPEETCRALLGTVKRAVLSLHGDNGYPYGIPVNFYYEETSGSIYIHCAKSGHKLDALCRSDKVCLTLTDEGTRREDWSYYVRSVIVFGHAALVEDRGRMTEMLRKLGCRYYPSPEEVEQEIAHTADRFNMLEIRIDHISGKLVHEK